MKANDEKALWGKEQKAGYWLYGLGKLVLEEEKATIAATGRLP